MLGAAQRRLQTGGRAPVPSAVLWFSSTIPGPLGFLALYPGEWTLYDHLRLRCVCVVVGGRAPGPGEHLLNGTFYDQALLFFFHFGFSLFMAETGERAARGATEHSCVPEKRRI